MEERSEAAEGARGLAAAVRGQLARAVVGQEEAVELLLVALLSRGHVLIEDVPGTGKTRLAESLARMLDLPFRRVQCTPDLEPSDLTGARIFDQEARRFVFLPGPLFASVVLVDEINRALPRTQAALLEAMQERRVSEFGEVHELPWPFLVIATQNPVESVGTFPLPEAELDRFLLRVRLGYPSPEAEVRILEAAEVPLETLRPVAGAAALRAAMEEAGRVALHPDVARYLTELVRATRTHPAVELGASPRATVALARAARARAALAGRAYVLPDDVQALAVPVLAHRLRLLPEAEGGRPAASAEGRGEGPAEAVVRELLERVPVPVEEG
ncbi:MAG: AAA family ATPase [Firmicutes bacterium]|nr:AAA family ATPase [Bacillota bacterium]